MRMTMFRHLIRASLLVLPFLCFIPGQASADPVGACCLVSTCSCQVLDQTTCVSQGGVYYGDGTNCDPNPCSFASGACCLHDGSCIMACPYDCTAHGGVFYGYGQSCTPSPCGTSSVPEMRTEIRSWGKIKSIYR